jgi:hypothetical protein
MKKYIQKLINFRSYINSSPFSIWLTKIIPVNNDISDLFAFRIDLYEAVFVAENNLALLTTKNIPCKHILHFFDKDGCISNVHKIESEDFHCHIDLTKDVTGGVEIGSFTHHVEYDDNFLTKFKDELEDLSFQHRGYVGFRRYKKDFSFVHGNFGAMYIENGNIKSLARQRSKYLYTPQFIIKSNYNYDLIFSNPTSKNISIKFILNKPNSTETIKKVVLNPFATCLYTISSRSLDSLYNISWSTNLPIGRCTVFEYDDNRFDVFHS